MLCAQCRKLTVERMCGLLKTHSSRVCLLTVMHTAVPYARLMSKYLRRYGCRVEVRFVDPRNMRRVRVPRSGDIVIFDNSIKTGRTLGTVLRGLPAVQTKVKCVVLHDRRLESKRGQSVKGVSVSSVFETCPQDVDSSTRTKRHGHCSGECLARMAKRWTGFRRSSGGILAGGGTRQPLTSS